MNLDPRTLTWDQWKATGRHVSTFLGGTVTGLVTLHLLSGSDGQTLLNAFAQIGDGIGKIAAGLVAIAGVVAPIYSAIRASKSASPDNQAAATVKNIENNVPINGKKAELIKAIADSPEVAVIKLKDPALAEAIPTPKVTT